MESVIDGILRLEAAEAAASFDSARIQRWAAEFATPVFLRRMREFVLAKMPGSAQAMTEAEPAMGQSNSRSATVPISEAQIA